MAYEFIWNDGEDYILDNRTPADEALNTGVFEGKALNVIVPWIEYTALQKQVENWREAIARIRTKYKIPEPNTKSQVIAIEYLEPEESVLTYSYKKRETRTIPGVENIIETNVKDLIRNVALKVNENAKKIYMHHKHGWVVVVEMDNATIIK